MHKVIPITHSQVYGCIGLSSDPTIVASPQIKRGIFMLEDFRVNLSHDHGKESEED